MKKELLINGTEFSFDYTDDVKIDFSLLEENDGIAFYKVSFDWGREVTPRQISLYYEIPAVDMYFMWDPINKIRDMSFPFRATESRLPSGMPLKSIVSRDSTNSYLVALADVKTPISINMRASQYRPMAPVRIDFFTMLCGPFSTYETVIRIDKRRIPFEQAIYSARDWFDSLGYKNDYIPDAAKRPMYSTWYSYTQSISAEAALRECKEAVRYGMDTIIVDDGWHTQDYNSMYGHCGDWDPDVNKFPDMKGFVDAVHAMGMKVILWYATPFIGKLATMCREFEGMFLHYTETSQNYDMDPRYKKVRDFIIETLSHAVRDWGFDGLKLDFINAFKTNGEYNDAMDVVSVEDATEMLLKEVNSALRAIDPDVLIEFRQPYFGPVVSTYGNMMRVWDCPLDGCSNRVQTLNLRLVSGECAVHSDMMYWNAEDTNENVATQLWGTMFSVPQISARMEEITEEHSRILMNYLNFWNAHRDILINERLSLKLCENGYGIATAARGDERVTMLADNEAYALDSNIEVDYAVNITANEEIILKNNDGAAFVCSVRDCKGDIIGEDIEVRDRLTEIAIPRGGMVIIKRQ